MMRYSVKKFISLLCVVAMLVGMFPASAFAAADTPAPEPAAAVEPAAPAPEPAADNPPAEDQPAANPPA